MHELLVERLVEPVGVGEVLLRLGRERVGALGHGIERAARRGVHHEEGHERHGEERWDQPEEAIDRVAEQRTPREIRPAGTTVFVTIGKGPREVKREVVSCRSHGHRAHHPARPARALQVEPGADHPQGRPRRRASTSPPPAAAAAAARRAGSSSSPARSRRPPSWTSCSSATTSSARAIASPASAGSPSRSPCRWRRRSTSARFQILGGERLPGAPAPMTIDAGIGKQVVTVALPREEHHQTSDLEELLAAVGPDDRTTCRPRCSRPCPPALRDHAGEVTVTTFGRPHPRRRAPATPRCIKFGLAIDIGTTSVVTTLMELESGEQLASVSSLNPQAVFGGDLMSRIAFAQFDPGNLRKLQTRIIGLLNQHIEQIVPRVGRAREVDLQGRRRRQHLHAPHPARHRPLVRRPRALRAGDAPSADAARPRALPEGRTRRRASASCRSWRASSAPTPSRWRSPRASTRPPEIRIAVDIGTNGEVLLGSRERLWACSAPAGPALEGRADPPRHARARWAPSTA